jgi:hypothetical protein
MTAPLAYPSVAQFDGVAKELPATPGTPVPMVATMPLATDLKWEDKPLMIPDKGLRGVMGNDSFNEVQGVYYCDVTAMGGAVFMDTLGYLLGNILGDVVDTGTAAPFSHKFALLNPTSSAPTAQPTTHTWTHYDGPTPTVGGRVIPYFCLSQLVITWEYATGLLTWSGKGQGWKSIAAASRPVAAPSAVQPKAAWIGQFGVGGTVGGAPVTNLEKFTLTINRELELEYTGNSQNPLMVARGGVSSTFDATFLAQDYTYYNDLFSNTQPQMQGLFTTGSAGTTQSLQIDAQQAAFNKAAQDGSKKMLRWAASGKNVFNSTNVGASGGQGPVTLTLQNAVAAGTYV